MGPARNQREAGRKRCSHIAEISDYTGNRREMQDSKSVPIGCPIGQNEPPAPIGCPTQPSDMFLQNAGFLSKCKEYVKKIDYTALYARRYNSTVVRSPGTRAETWPFR
jgi:hypothetical protein